MTPEDGRMETSREQRRAVARDQCRMYGHSFDYAITMATFAPQRVSCSTCGSSWRIHPDDLTRNFGCPE
jgi:hypothetical protein